MSGILYGVSVGAGDPELMTLKAVRFIKESPVIAAPETKGEKCAALSIAEQVCDLSGKTIVNLKFTMSRDKEVLRKSHEDIAKQISEYLDRGESVAFLTIGDISVYSTFSYIAEILTARGYEVEICAGVPSFCAAAAAVKEPLVLGAQPLIVIPAGCVGSADFDKLCSLNGTKVIMKSGRSLSEIRANFYGKRVLAVENCGYHDQKIYHSLDEIGDGCGYFTTIIIK